MISFIATLTIGYVLMCFLLFIFHRQMIYFSTSEVNVPGIAYTPLDTGEVRINVWTNYIFRIVPNQIHLKAY